jgi:lycopene beta-cyclase
MSRRVVLAGGGLANGLIAYRLAATRDDLEIILLESAPALGGNHVWSFHDADLTAEQRGWISPLVEKSWSGHDVRFPALSRRLGGDYHSITSEKLHQVVGERLGDRLRTGAKVVEVAPRRVRLVDGSEIECDAVLDGRGDPGGSDFDVAYQKFAGRMLELDHEHELEAPLLMDATVEQRDGFRFFYTLPFSPRALFVEDTRYSDTPGLDRGELREEIDRYAAEQGWTVAGAGREEAGVLPIVLGGDIRAFWSRGEPGVPRTGMRAALFHPTTGYSLPEAVRLADNLTRFSPFLSEELEPWIRERSFRLWRRGAYFRFLNRMLFGAAEPERRYLVMQRFYRLSEPLIGRFYAGRPTLADRIRILTGKPPVPVTRAVKCIRAPRRRGAGSSDRSENI